MKLTAFLLLITVIHVSAGGLAQQSITYSAKGASLQKIFSVIKKQTGYKFFYDDADLKNSRPITVELKNETLKSALDKIFNDQPIQYTIEGKTIFVTKRSVTIDLHSDSSPPIDVKGRVVNDKGDPADGVTVTVKGTNKATSTNANGEFELKDIDENAMLIITGVGIETREVRPKGKQQLYITVKIAATPLDEVQLIAYGSTTRRFSTGNIASVKAADIEKQPVNNPLLALQGRVPGLFIVQNTGISGGGVTVRIQGINSIANGNSPLYVVDGVPVNSFLPQTTIDGVLRSSGGMNDAGNPLNYLNPSDIESIDILKDADATAIYGSRAANGAILITTKKGKSGKTKINVDQQNGWGSVTRKLDMLNTRQFLDMRYEAAKNDNISLSSLDQNSNYDLTVWDTTRYTDWQRELIGGTAKYINSHISVSGGTPAMQFLIGASYKKETTVFPLPDEFADQQGSVHFNISNNPLGERFKIQLSANYLVDKNTLPFQDLTQWAIQLDPVAPSLYNSDGSINWFQNASGTSTFAYNPMAYTYIKYENRTSNLVSNLVAGYRIMSGLNMSVSLGYNTTVTKDYTPTPLLAIKPEDRPFTLRSAAYGDRTVASWVVEPQLNYKKTFNQHNFELLIGSTLMENTSEGSTLLGQGHSSDNLLKNASAASTVYVFNNFNFDYKYAALFGRLNYKWADKYVINVTGRRDGSSRFGSANQFHNFGSVGAAYILSNERFLKNLLPVVSFAKLRASYGTTGNDQIADYSFMSLYNIMYSEIPYENIVGLRPSVLSNPYLAWEETKKFQVGFDLGVLKDKILFNVTYQINRSSSQLISSRLPVITGFTAITKNFPALVQNTSWEFSLQSTNVKTKNVEWTSSINVTIPKNKLVSFPDLATSDYANLLVLGQPVNMVKAFHFLGVNKSTGIYEVADHDGKPTSSPDYLLDRTVYINTLPKFYGGLSNSMTFRDFHLEFLFQFVKQTGPNIFFNGGGFPNPGESRNGVSNQPVTVLNRWQNAGDADPIQAYHFEMGDHDGYVDNVLASDAAFSDASYVRLKNLSISWQLPEQWKTKAHLEDCRLYVNAQNVFTITKYQGLDPENQTVYSLPPLRILSVGLQLGL